MDRDSHGTRRIVGMSEHMMTADDSIKDESRADQGTYYTAAANDRQAATVTRRISGGASAGMASP